MATGNSTRLRFGYACGSLVTGTFTTLPGLLLLPYLTDTLGVGAALAGVVILVPKAWAVLLAPFAGRTGDRTHRRRGSRCRHVLGGGLGATAAFAVMLAGVADGTAGMAWTGLGFLLTATAFAFFQAAYAALPADIAHTPHDRMRLVSGRVAGIAVAALAVGSAGPAVVEAGGGGIGGHRWAGLFGAAVIAAGTLGVHLGTARPPRTTAPGAPSPADTDRTPAGRRFDALRDNPSFAALLRTTTVQVVATGCLLAAGPYFAEHILHDPDLTALLVAAFVVPNLFVTPLWARFGARHGQRTALVAASALFGGGCLLLAAAPALPPLWAPAVLLLVGTGHAGQLLFLYAMLAETTAADTARTGRSRAGALSGLFSGGEALGVAAGPFLFALVLQLFGYTSSDTGESARQTTTAEWGVLAGMTLLPALVTVVGLLLLRGYRATAPAPAPHRARGEAAQPRL
ncbi:MFS transporter [Streptomyces sp. NPDC056045]|uniref:MFS transporter n=1 Tax=Streptomyces sp. NPDC056045 TaxID=3345691 RepID=UPI0035D547BE